MTTAFDFRLRWQIGVHRAQVAVGANAAIAIAGGQPSATTDHLMERVEDAGANREQARSAGAAVSDLEDHPYGERQYTATDFAGRSWVFTQSIADLDPADWGATTG